MPGSVRPGVRLVAEGEGRGRAEGGAAAAATPLEQRAAASDRGREGKKRGKRACGRGVPKPGNRGKEGIRAVERAEEKRAPGVRRWLPRAGDRRGGGGGRCGAAVRAAPGSGSPPGASVALGAPLPAPRGMS